MLGAFSPVNRKRMSSFQQEKPEKAIAQTRRTATRVGGYKLPCMASFLHVEPFKSKLGFLAILLAWDGPP
ncbi:hypothetical protein GQ457_09G019530 [Hibiscus cannabinus]